MRLPFVAGLALCISLASGCQSKPAKASREECSKVAEHITELILADFMASPPEWFDAVAQEPGDTEIPKEIDRTTFAAFLATEPGKTWLLKRRGHTLSAVQQGVDLCVDNATPAYVTCLLGAKSKADVTGCDEKHAKKTAAPATPPAAGSAEIK